MYISATGMICPVGLNADSACSAMRSGIANFDELPYYDTSGELVIGSVVPGLTADFESLDRLVELLSRAITDCLSDEPHELLHNMPLLVGLAEPGRPGGGAGLADLIIARVERQLKLRFHAGLSHTLPKGHTAGFEAMRLARYLLQNDGVPACLVCGVDSYINADSLLWLEQHWRLKTADNSNGVIPGETAAAVLVRPQPTSPTHTLVNVAGLGFAVEKVSIHSEEPFLSLGLTAAARAALGEAGLPMNEIAFRLSDATGEQYSFKEQGLTVTRLIKVPVEELPIWHCADSIGDTGAAAGVCQLVSGYHAFAKGYAPGDRALCFTSAVLGDRASLVLERRESGVERDTARSTGAALTRPRRKRHGL